MDAGQAENQSRSGTPDWRGLAVPVAVTAFPAWSRPHTPEILHPNGNPECIMKVGQYCKRSVTAVSGSTDVANVARLMREKHVGFLAVYKEGDDQRKPVGVITDRDIVLQVTALDLNAQLVTAEDIMTRQPLIAREGDELSDALQAMRLSGIRRVPVVDARGALTGIIAMDDAIALVTELMCDISGTIRSEQREEWRKRGELTAAGDGRRVPARPAG